MARVLNLERIDERAFRGHTPEEYRAVRVFGGQMVAQALAAAGRTVPAGRHVHSLHSYFLRPGDPRRPIKYCVDPVRDGGSFTTRRVVAAQDTDTIFELSASFQREHRDQLRHQGPLPETPDPESANLSRPRRPVRRAYGGVAHEGGRALPNRVALRR